MFHFHISRYYRFVSDYFFTCTFSCLTVEITDPEFPDIYYFEVEENSSVECGMVFSPKEVSSSFCY